MAARHEPRWLLLLHQLPRKPDYLRVKVWRRLQRLGAVSIKNAVYALPRSEERNEDLQWVMREIQAGGGEATLVEANLVQGLRDDEVEALFNRARDADYQALAVEIRAAAKHTPKQDAARKRLAVEIERLRRRMEEIAAIDFFQASGRETAAGLLAELRARLDAAPPATVAKPEKFHGRTWVTRKGIHVDRMASAWLIRRFLDPAARFKWVAPKGYRPRPGELRFDMFEAEFTHVGDRCSFEVLLERSGVRDRALTAIAEIVHDIDIKDERYRRPETAGVASLVAGIALGSDDDDQRLARAGAALDQLYAVFTRRRSG